MNIYELLAKVQAAIADKGIGKNQKNEYDKYNFRGIDDVYNVMGPILANEGVVIVPQLVGTDTVTAETSGGKATFHTKLVVKYVLYAPDGSHVESAVPGEAMDRGDKSQNKAMSAAYKNMMFQLFCIPVQGQDSEAESHEIVAATVSDAQLGDLQQLYADLNEQNQGKFMSWLYGKRIKQLEEVPADAYDAVLGVLHKAYSQQYAQEQALSAQALGEA